MGYTKLIVLLTICTLALGCAVGVRNTYDNNGNKIASEPFLSVLQLQTEEGSATVYSDTAAGFRAKIPIPGVNALDVLDITLGYIRSTRGVVPTKNNGELPTVIVDTSVNPFNKDGVTDTYLLGDKAVQELYEEATETEEEENP